MAMPCLPLHPFNSLTLLFLLLFKMAGLPTTLVQRAAIKAHELQRGPAGCIPGASGLRQGIAMEHLAATLLIVQQVCPAATNCH
jgi:hypothetical protein